MYKTVPNVIIDMIKKGEESGSSSAKEFLLLSKKLSDEEKSSLNVFGTYTLEVLLIHVLSTLFNAVESNSVIRLSTLIDRLDTTVRSQITLLMRRKFDRYWTPNGFSLPMVCKPEDWVSILPENKKPKYLSDIRGGYLKAYIRFHTNRSYCTTYNSGYFSYDVLYTRILNTTYAAPHQGLILSSHEIDPGFSVNEMNLISLSIFDLLIRYVFSSVEGYSKCNILFTLVGKDGNDITYSIVKAIPLTTLDGSAFLPTKDLFLLDNLFEELYHDYQNSGYDKQNHLSILFDTPQDMDVEVPVSQPISNKKRTYNSSITQISSSKQKGVTPFMVADIETILIEDDTGLEVQTPYAAVGGST
ncbi:hypothetical protein CASFOL_009581 [Castilleja foliolosa]|uniref:Uncharacterized protein n=1 Tax=Castilleja foliolosa TaxID=1961234 RepID=A0ABD3E0P9_9LAMI